MLQLGRLTGSTFTFLNGEVRSVQPDGTVETRPAGSNGAYEQVVVQGSLAVSFSTFGSAPPWCYVYVAQVPNQPSGVGAMGTVPVPA